MPSVLDYIKFFIKERSSNVIMNKHNFLKHNINTSSSRWLGSEGETAFMCR